MATVGKEVLCPGFPASIPGAAPSLLRNPSNHKAPTHPALHGHWRHQVEKGRSWPALSPCSIGPAWSRPAGWPEFCSHCGLLRTRDGGDKFRRRDADPAPSHKDTSNLVTIGSHQRSHCCLCHEAGVPGSCGRQLGKLDCQWPPAWSKALQTQPPIPFLLAPGPLVPKCPAYPCPSPFPATQGLT